MPIRTKTKSPLTVMPQFWSYTIFSTDLGYMAMAGDEQMLQWLTIGHKSAAIARKSLVESIREHAPDVHLREQPGWNEKLTQRLIDYAGGFPDDFLDAEVPYPTQPFAAKVARQCREIPYGQTLSYGELAAKAGSSNAARAVGNTMACNRLPLIIPCHRVLASGGAIGGYSAAGGLTLKQRLLDLETGNS